MRQSAATGRYNQTSGSLKTPPAPPMPSTSPRRADSTARQARIDRVECLPDDDASPDSRLLQTIDAAEELTGAQRRALAEIYRAFIDANAVRRTRSAASS